LDAEISYDIQFSDDGRFAYLDFFVEEGQLYTLREIQLRGNSELKESELLPLLRMRPGDPVTEARLSSDIQAIVEYYGNRGYPMQFGLEDRFNIEEERFANDEDLFAFDSSPRLELDPPIDVDSSLMVRLRLELLDPSSPSQTLVVTLAGVQFAFQVDRTVGHWRADTSSAQATLAALRTSGSRADSFPPFPEGRAFEVQLRVHARQARIEEILIDGRALDRPPLLSPAPDLRAPTLEVRAAERMRLLSVVLEGKQL
jgi:hypothetical protein